MHLLDGKPVFSATDLVGFVACDHLTELERAALANKVPGGRPNREDPVLDAIRERGLEHEARFKRELEAQGRKVTVIRPDACEIGPEGSRTGSGKELRDQAHKTREAILRGDDVIYQAAFFDGRWRGHADFLLRRNDKGSLLGPYSYEVADTKLAHKVKASAILQICSYIEQLARIQGVDPEVLYVALGGSARAVEGLRVADYMAYYRTVKARFEAAVNPVSGRVVDYPPPETYPDPVDHCGVCRWLLDCKSRWRNDDALALVAGITRSQRKGLTELRGDGFEFGVKTRRQLAVLPLPVPKIKGTSREALERVREQARLQVQGEDAGQDLYEVLDPRDRKTGEVTRDHGLASLPPPSPGDLFFDIEGDPFALDEGLEYLFGVWEPGPGFGLNADYHCWWAFDRAEEKRAFENLVDFLIARLERDPGMHVYHYASYERGRMGRLSTMHGTREAEADRLLRAGVFVDLYRAVRQGVRISQERYSIKNLEPYYHLERQVELREAGKSVVEFERWLAMGEGEDVSGRDARDNSILDLIREYNKDDCLSAWKLREWLEERRLDAERQFGVTLPRPTPRGGDPSDDLDEQEKRIQALVTRLSRDVPADEADRTGDEHGRWLLAQLLEWHRREDKSTWWRFFDLMEMTDEELVDQREPIGLLTYEGVREETKGSLIHRYSFPPQDTEIKAGTDVFDRATRKDAGEVAFVDPVAGVIDLKRGKKSEARHPTGLVPLSLYRNPEQRGSLERIATWVADHGLRADAPDYRAARDLLLRLPPRAGQQPGHSLARSEEDGGTAARRLVLQLDSSVLAIQGPPGSGKTYTGARMIVDLVKDGKKVGVTSNSHKVIGGLLEEVCKYASEIRFEVKAIQKASESQRCSARVVRSTDDNRQVRDALASGEVMIGAGTAWLWSRLDMADAVDTLFVDEAGQVALANTVAVSQAARNVVLLGDPQQLDQPLKGAHPTGAERSALGHLLGALDTMPAERGLFFERTRRLHPNLCAFTSEVFYESRLRPVDGAQRIDLRANPPFTSAGLYWLPVEHHGNRQESAEEVEAVAGIVRSLLGGSWTDREGQTHVIAPRDILVVAPYNAQVAAISHRLGATFEGRIGTVDKFQGREAAISIYSMATSAPDDAPRGMEFLYSLNRLNVATSRAKALAAVVCSPRLLGARCHTPRQVQLANALCRFVEMERMTHGFGRRLL